MDGPLNHQAQNVIIDVRAIGVGNDTRFYQGVCSL